MNFLVRQWDQTKARCGVGHLSPQGPNPLVLKISQSSPSWVWLPPMLVADVPTFSSWLPMCQFASFNCFARIFPHGHRFADVLLPSKASKEREISGFGEGDRWQKEKDREKVKRENKKRKEKKITKLEKKMDKTEIWY